MKRCFSVLILALLSTAFAAALPSDPSLVPVRATHQRATRHHAHKAGKHHHTKRSHRHSV
jgi:hypothetical protein